jgi:hypothetical protein
MRSFEGNGKTTRGLLGNETQKLPTLGVGRNSNGLEKRIVYK